MENTNGQNGETPKKPRAKRISKLAPVVQTRQEVIDSLTPEELRDLSTRVLSTLTKEEIVIFGDIKVKDILSSLPKDQMREHLAKQMAEGLAWTAVFSATRIIAEQFSNDPNFVAKFD